MKRTERHHLKENELSVLAKSARRVAEERSGPLLSFVVALAVLAVVALGYFGWRGRVLISALRATVSHPLGIHSATTSSSTRHVNHP